MQNNIRAERIRVHEDNPNALTATFACEGCQKFPVTFIKGDLLNNTTPSHNVIAHCITKDAIMSAGIAKTIRDMDPNIKRNILSQRKLVGHVAPITTFLGEREFRIYNLITKNRIRAQEELEASVMLPNIESCLEATKLEMLRRNEKVLAVPMLGCGLDRQEWPKVLSILKKVFINSGISLVVYVLDSRLWYDSNLLWMAV